MKVSVINVVYNSKKYIKPVFDAIFAQTEKDLEVFAVVCANDDSSKEFLQANYPQVRILDPGKNLGFSSANNLAIRESTGEFIQLINPDLILEPNYIEGMLKIFVNPKVAAATGKILRYDFEKNRKTSIIDTTGITMSVSGRARDRGQNQIDRGQFDQQTEVFGVSGAGPMYRRSALEKVKYCYRDLSPGPSPVQPPDKLKGVAGHPLPQAGEGKVEENRSEYFDEDFFMYWEDVDLSWRLNNSGFRNVYVPSAVAYHGRTAGQATGGYLHLFKFIQHHQKLSPQILRWNYKNHILMYIKNAKHIWHPAFVLRELIMLGYIIVFETGTLKVIPELFRQISKILAKRKAGTR